MKNFVLVIAFVLFSPIVFASETTMIDEDFSTKEMVISNINQNETFNELTTLIFNELELDPNSGGWCCFHAWTETRAITACSDQGCAAAFAIFVEMHTW